MKGTPKQRREKELLPPPGRRLTRQQQIFVNAYLEGDGPLNSYRKAYPDSRLTDKNKGVEAHRIIRRPVVAAAIDQGRAKADEAALLTRIEKRRLLAEIARRKQAKAPERIKAIEVDNTMSGHNAPQQVEVFGIAELMRLVRSGREA